MTAEQRVFDALVATFEHWRDKRITRVERAAALGSLSSLAHALGWDALLQDALEQNGKRR